MVLVSMRLAIINVTQVVLGQLIVILLLDEIGLISHCDEIDCDGVMRHGVTNI